MGWGVGLITPLQKTTLVYGQAGRAGDLDGV